MRDLGTVLNNLQNTNIIDIKMPTFSNELETNPKSFLEELDRYFKIKNINADTRKMMLAEHALEYQARTWIN